MSEKGTKQVFKARTEYLQTLDWIALSNQLSSTITIISRLLSQPICCLQTDLLYFTYLSVVHPNHCTIYLILDPSL